MQTPGANKYKVNYDFNRPRTPFVKMGKPKDEENRKISIRPKKDMKRPAVGSYNVDSAVRTSTQWKNQPRCIFDKVKGDRYLDQAAKNKKWVPGVGHYKEYEKQYNSLSIPPTSLRRRR